MLTSARSILKTSRLAAAALACAVLASAPAAASADPFSALVGKRRDAEAERAGDEARVQRYIVSADGRAFLFVRDGRSARVKFLCGENDPRLDCRIDPAGSAEEIFLIYGTRGPRGDTIYKDADGDTVLRIGAYGGATVFWPGERYGQPAAKSYGEGAAVILAQSSRRDAHRRARFATAHMSAVTGEPIVFDISRRRAPPSLSRLQAAPVADAAPAAEQEEATDTDHSADGEALLAPVGSDATVLADAIARVASGMQRVADDPTGARIMGARIHSVRFIEGAGPALSLEGDVFVVVFDPTAGLVGRPTSGAVFHFLEESL